MKNAKRWLAVFLVATLVVAFVVGLAACDPKGGNYDNEKDAFAMSIQNPDGVFNPFFSTSAYDSSIISLTQISMLNTDKVGNLIAGLDQPTVALAFDIDYTDEKGNQISETEAADHGYTDYRLLIKNGIKFSDGTPLTITDVLFNLYVYLDPVFTGSATIYSTDIVGLNAYRTQDVNASEATNQGFDEAFTSSANIALKELNAWVKVYASGVSDKMTDLNDGWFSDGEAHKNPYPWTGNTEFTSKRAGYVGNIQVTYQQMRDKVNHIASLYYDELLADWNGINMDDYRRKKEQGPDYDTKFTETWQVFALNDMMDDTIVMRMNGDDNDEGGFQKTPSGGDYILHEGRAQAKYNEVVNAYKEDKNIDVNALSGQAKEDAIRDAFIWSQFTSVFGYSAVRTVDQGTGIASYQVTVPDMSASSFEQVVNYWGTSAKVFDELIAEAKTSYFGKSTLAVPNISGISVEKVDSFTGKQTAAPGAPDVTIRGAHDVLHIRINKVDPKALMNFAFTVAPMHYYSNPSDSDITKNTQFEDQVKLFNDDWAKWEAAGANPEDFNTDVNHFGVKYGDSNFMNDVVNAPSKIVKPLGAGAYQASNDAGEQDFYKVTGGGSTGFFDNNIIFYTRNSNFWTVGADGGSQESSKLQNAKIKTVVYKVVASDQVINSLVSREIHFGDPSATQKNVEELINAGLNVVRTLTSGYGYIGINPRYVPEHQVRQAIMKAMDIQTDMISGYYEGGFAERIYRPMSKASWAYPKDAEEMYTYDATGEEIEKLVREAGYEKNSAGLFEKSGKTLDIKFTIAGSSVDHPAYNCFLDAQKLLNAHGFNVQVVTSAQALSDLSAGKLAVWAAAWSSAIDPDMYQIYHVNSQASSTSNWGYKQIKANPSDYNYEYQIINGETKYGKSLSALIDEARETNDQATRTELYAQCLDLVMDLAVELPTYQRYDIAVYDKNIIDVNSLPKHTPGKNVNDADHSDIGPYYGLLSRIWEVSFA